MTSGIDGSSNWPGDATNLAALKKPFWVQVTSYDGVKYYGWTEQDFTNDAVFLDLPGGRSGTTTVQPLYASNSSILTIGNYYLIRRESFDPDVDWIYTTCGPGTSTGSPTLLEVVTNVCPTIVDGAVTTITVEKRLVTLPPGSEVSDPYCEIDPNDCCPTGSGGSGVLGNISEIQSLYFSSGVESGTFTITYPSNLTTSSITYSTVSATMVTNIQTALDSIFGSGNTLVVSDETNLYLIYFTGELEHTNLLLMLTDSSSLVGGTATIFPVQDGDGNEAQIISFLSGDGTATISFFGEAATSALTVTSGSSPTAAQVQTHLDTIGMIDGQTFVFGEDGGPFTVVFNGSLDNVTLDLLTADSTGDTVTSISQLSLGHGNEAQTISISGTNASTFTLSYDAVGGSSPLTFTSGSSPTAAQVLTHLETIPFLNNNVAVLGSDSGPFLIVFINNLSFVAGLDLITSAVDSGSLTITIEQMSEGEGGGGGAPVLTSCCPSDAVPRTLNLNIASGGGGGGCSCLYGDFTLTYDSGDTCWYSEALSVCSTTVTWRLRCRADLGDEWYLDFTTGCTGGAILTNMSCAPVAFGPTVLTITVCCSDDIQAAVTE